MVFENATCKNGKAAQRYHLAEAVDPGQTWPDQVEEKVKDLAEREWELNLAERCKGEGEVKVVVPDAPFADKESLRKWFKDSIRAHTNSAVKRAVRVEHDPVKF